MTRAAAAGLALVLLPACAGGEDGGDAPRRVFEVKTLDTLRFDPPTLTSNAGERVTFRVTNTGKMAHEFVVGDAKYHEGHEAAANAGGSHGAHMDGDGAAVEVAPGETKTVDYTMPSTAPTYACHISAHDDAGMTGTVSY